MPALTGGWLFLRRQAGQRRPLQDLHEIEPAQIGSRLNPRPFRLIKPRYHADHQPCR
jgi:hypothetical protein